MNVSALQALLRNLAPAVQAVGASQPVIKGLSEIADALSPFAERDLSAFRVFLAQAEEFERTGKVTFPEKKAAQPKKPAFDAATAAAPVREIEAFIGGDPSRREEARARWAEAGIERLKAPELRAVAAELGITIPETVTQGKDIARLIYKSAFRAITLSADAAIPRVADIQSAAMAPGADWAELEGRYAAIGMERADEDDLLRIANNFGIKPKKGTPRETIQDELRTRILDREAGEIRRVAQAVRAIEEDAAAPETTREEVETQLNGLGLDRIPEGVLSGVAAELGCKIKKGEAAESLIKKVRNVPLSRKETRTLNLV